MGTEEYSTNLRRGIRQLQEKSKIKSTLKPLAKRGSITAKVRVGKRSGSAAASGIKSPLTETDNTRTYYGTPQTLTSSDGLFVLEWYAVSQITMTDADVRELKFVYDQP